MNTRYFLAATAVLFGLLLAACGPSAEEIAAMTAEAATPTPIPTDIPTATPTPVPIDVTVTVTDAEGNPIPFASVLLPQAGDDEPITVNTSGQISWTDISGEEIDLSVSAQGYTQLDSSYTLERGANDITVTLERDAAGLLPSEACGPNETALYIEDFQDREAAGMDEINFNAQGWEFADDELNPGNVFVQVTTNEADGFASTSLWQPFGNAVWRSYFVMGNTGGMSFNWHHTGGFELEGEEIFDSRYQIVFDAGGRVEIRRLQQPVTNIGVRSGFVTYTRNWDLLEVSSFDGEVKIWLNGQEILSYTDPAPVPDGGFGYEIWHPFTFQLDNVSVCALSGPFESLYMPPAEQ